MKKFYNKMNKLLLLAVFLIGFGQIGLGQDILLNGNFEAWDNSTTPTSWTHVENTAQESSVIHGGTYSAKHTGGTKDLGQLFSVNPNTSYTLTLWYKVASGDATSARIWSYWKSSGSNLSDNANELRGPNGDYFDNNGGAWTKYEVTFTSPATADEFYFEVRTYSGAVVYWDDFSFVDNSASTSEVDWCNLQWPASGTIRGGNNFDVYARVYEPGVTDAVGQGANITAWIGYNTIDNDPEANDATWTWVAATYGSDQGNNDEYIAEIGSTLAGGTYYYASKFQYDGGPFKYGGYNGGFWDGTTNVSGVLTVDDTPDGCNIQSPENGNVFLGAGFTVYAQIWENDGTDYTNGAGQAPFITAEIGYNTVDNDPEANSGTWTWTSATYNAAVTGTNDEYSLDLEATIGATGTYYYASRFKMGNGSYYYGGYNSGFWSNTYADGIGNKSGQLIIIKPEPTNYPTNFDCGTNITGTTMDITWTDAAAGTTEPDGYLLKWGTSYGAITAPVDGTPEADDEVTTGSGAKNIAFSAGNLYTVANLNQNTNYYFKIWSYTNSGAQIDYKLTGEPNTTCKTIEEPINLFCDNFEDNLNDWIVTNNSGVNAIIATTYGGDDGTHACVFDLTTTTTGKYTSVLEKEFQNVKNIHIDFSYYVKYYKYGTIKIYLKQGVGAYSQVYFIKGSTETGTADITVDAGTDAQWNYTGDIDLSANSATLDDYTIKIEGTSSRDGTFDNEVAIDAFCVDAIQITCSTPTNPATLGSTSNIGSAQMDVNWVRGDGDNVIVIARQGSAVAFTPTDLNTYAANSSFGSGTDLGSGQYCVYNGSGTSVTVTNLLGSTDYYFAVYEYGCTAGSELYLTSSPATVNGTTLAPAPEINVNQAGTDYLHNSTYDFGTVGVGSNSPRTFTIENTGNANLTFSALTITGSGDYTVSTQPTSPIAGGGNDNFVITFAPTSVGTITGYVTITNNDSDEGSYVINFTGVGSPSDISDIIVNSTFDEPDNIDYTLHLEANLTNTSLEVAQFTIRDGGAANDADGEVTELTDITFSVSNSANLQRIAIYDGATEIQEVAAGASVTFSGISLTAADNSTKTFSIRASFNTTVTDNQQFQFTVTSATANPATSTFAAADAGGAFSSIAGDDNRIIVTAKNLFFDNQPSNTGVNATMAAVTVIAVDDELNIDLDYIGNVTITSTSANMTGDPITVAASSGTATFSSIIHTVAGTGYTLTTTATGLLSDISSTYDITEFVFLAGDYRSTADYVDFSWNNTAGTTVYWEYYDGTSWGVTPGDLSPQNAATTPSRVIINNVGVSGGGNTTNSYHDIIILNGAELIVNDVAANPVNTFVGAGDMLEVQSGGTFIIRGNFNLAGTSNLIVRSGGTMTIDEPSMRNDDEIWNGTENFESGSTVQINDWDWTGTAMYRSLVNLDDDISYNIEGYKFGYFILNKTTSVGEGWTIIGGPVGIINLCYNDFTINNSSTDCVGGISNSTGTPGFIINGNFIVNSGDFAFSNTYSNTDFRHQATINGNFEYNGSGSLKMHYNGNSLPTTMTSYTTFKGNVYVAPTATITNDPDAAGNYMYINFDGTSDVDIQTSLSYTDMFVKTGATANLVYDMDLTGTNSVLTVDNGGIWQIMPTINMTAPTSGIVQNAGSTGFVIKSDATGTGSLIQQDAFAATYERYLTGGSNVWHDIFSPLSSANLPTGYVYSYDESKPDIWNMTTNFGFDGSDFVANNNYIGWVSTSSFATTQGYIISSETQTAIITGGNLDVSDKTFNVQKTTHSGTIPTSGNDPNGISYSGCVNNWNDYDGWVFVGNPYASALDWSVAYTGDVDIESGIYIWDDGAKNYKYFLDPDGSNSTFTVGIDVNGDGNTQYIPSGQGFFVKSANASGSFTIPATARTHTTHTFWKGDKEILPNLLRINITKDDFTDETVLFSVKGASDNFDGSFDLHKRFSIDATVPQIYSMNDEKSQFALNSFELKDHKIVPLGLYINNYGEYSINVTENSFENTHVWLEDRLYDTLININNPGSYIISQTIETNINRFFVHFNLNTEPYIINEIPDQTTPVNEIYTYTLSDNIFKDNDYGDKLTLTASLANGDDLPEWLNFDSNLRTFTGVPSEVEEIDIIVTATDLFGESISSNFTLIVYENTTSFDNSNIEKMISVYPNPTHNIVNVTIPDILSNTTITIFDASGRTVIIQNATSSINSIDVSNLSQGIYLIEIKDDISFTRKKLIIK